MLTNSLNDMLTKGLAQSQEQLTTLQANQTRFDLKNFNLS
jgi:hypothetical protein